MYSIDPSSFNHKYTTLGEYKYHYVGQGNPDGPTVLLIHGFPDFWFGWRYQIRHLAAQGYHVLAIDNLGGGETDAPKCVGFNVHPYRTKNLANNLIKLLDQLHISKAVVVGHDWGATVAWKVGLHFPERCHAIVSVGNPHRFPTAEFFGVEHYVQENPAFAYFSFFEKPEADAVFDSANQILIKRMFGRDDDERENTGTGEGTTDEDVQYYIDTFARSGYHGLLNYYRSFRLNHQDELALVGQPYTVPSLLMVVKNDNILTPDYVAGVPKDGFTELERVMIEEGTHLVLTENHEGVNAQLDQYLTKLAQRGIIHLPSQS